MDAKERIGELRQSEGISLNDLGCLLPAHADLLDLLSQVLEDKYELELREFGLDESAILLATNAGRFLPTQGGWPPY